MAHVHQPSSGEDKSQPPTYRTDSAAYLAGKKSLTKAFWIVFILGNGVMKLLGSATFYGAFAITTHSLRTSTGVTFDPYHVGIAVAFAQGIYFVFSTLVVWRCSPNTTSPYLRYGVRSFVALLFVIWLWRFLGFVLFAVSREYG
jgi:hypothetical protein